ncbi:MAG TPA: LysR family transcriptional regulator [Arenibaculum sp.]|nr:LysR family transcriptional regulator [Arenibaculum sp.]
MDLIGDLELMLELATHGSFSTVGRLRGKAPSSIARRLDRLEGLLGERLFNRTPTGLFLTATGERKLAQARDLAASAAAFVGKASSDGQPSGPITVSAPSRLGAICVAPVVATFLADNPGVVIDLHLTDVVQDLDREKIDLAVRIGGRAPDHHVIRRIAGNRRILVAAPSYLAGRAPITDPCDLDDCDGVLLGSAPSWCLRHPDGRQYAAAPRTRVRCMSGDAVLMMCEAGLGVGLKSSWDVHDAVSEGRLVHVLPGWEQRTPSDITIVMPDRRFVPHAVRAFSKVLEARLRRDLARTTGAR